MDIVDDQGDSGGRGSRGRPFNGMNIDDVLNGFNLESEDHDGITGMQ